MPFDTDYASVAGIERKTKEREGRQHSKKDIRDKKDVEIHLTVKIDKSKPNYLTKIIILNLIQ